MKSKSEVHAASGKAEGMFSEVRDAFVANFRERGEKGAALCVYQHGRKVVDLWGGVTGAVESAAYDANTLQLVFSTTKGAAAVCALMLADRGLLDLDAPVAEYWPEFAAAGKERIPVRMLLDHQAGLPVVDAALTFADVLDGQPVIRALEKQAPVWEPGTRHGYHATTYGWLVGEIVRRVSGRSLGRFFRDEIAGPLALDFWIGLPEAEERRVAPVLTTPPSDPAAIERMAALFAPGALFARALTMNGAMNPSDRPFNSRAFRAAELPSANGVTNARSLARLYAATLGEVDGVRLFGPGTQRRAMEVTDEGVDAVVGVGMRFGLGFMRDGGDVRLLGPDSYGHAGAGGSLGFADPPSGIAFGYVMNRMGSSLLIDDRPARLIDAVRRSLHRGA